MHYAIYKNSLTYGRISRDCAVSRSPQVNMSVQAGPPRRAMATYSRKSSTNRDIRIKRVPKKDVLHIEEPEDSNRCGEESEIGDKSADEAMEKGKQAKVVIVRADPYKIFRMYASDCDSEWKSMMKMAKSKKKVNNSHNTPNNKVGVRDL